jgi:hypothetical protein
MACECGGALACQGHRRATRQWLPYGMEDVVSGASRGRGGEARDREARTRRRTVPWPRLLTRDDRSYCNRRCHHPLLIGAPLVALSSLPTAHAARVHYLISTRLFSAWATSLYMAELSALALLRCVDPPLNPPRPPKAERLNLAGCRHLLQHPTTTTSSPTPGSAQRWHPKETPHRRIAALRRLLSSQQRLSYELKMPDVNLSSREDAVDASPVYLHLNPPEYVNAFALLEF